ncbi:Carbohydrate-binding family V/XII [Streptococcus porcinus]|uniref:N4-gp56 family major capsid protein n=1 Tax=Streptococcus porcinus TaxID=1340 RepID=UPI0010CAD275|nr:N4-gp56 family major capsid protein [Streptococcus porcinus]VTS32798.1 Carbohydrate-binding family V/XII [Streptococcus porcinus]
MVVNYASKFDTKVDERFAKEALSTGIINQDFDFTGVDTVKVYSVPTSKMNDYTASGVNRYGTAEELGNTVQTMILKKDRSFTFTIDKKSTQDTMGVMEAGKALARQLTEVIIPEIDTYRFATIVAGADESHVKTQEITKENAYESVLDAQVALTDAYIPVAGRQLHVSPAFYKLIKLDPAFVKNSDLGQEITIKGQVGMIDGMSVVLTPTSRLPLNVAFVVAHPIATTSPIKLEDYKIHDNPPGINGQLVEGRIRYDAFVLDNKKKAIFVHKTA